MAKKLFVGNLSFQISEDDLKKRFEEIGTCLSVKIITDKFTGKSKGFGFVEMEDDSAADASIQQLNGAELGGRKLTVNEARPQQERTGGYGGKPSSARFNKERGRY
jgi:RNA recognition motif-containing protein